MEDLKEEFDVQEQRQLRRKSFLDKTSWDKAEVEPLQADASFRRYYRLHGGLKPALLMEDPPDRSPVPPYVMVEPFITIAEHLGKIGLSTPNIYEQDLDNGLLLLEDFGDKTYTNLFSTGGDEKSLYELAIDVLVALHSHVDRNKIKLPKYSEELLLTETSLLMDWYYPALTGKEATKDMKDSLNKVWLELFKGLPEDQLTLVLRDYHVDNLMYLEGREGVKACGLLDFQDAVIGQFSYDVMSLIEDARRELAPELQEHLYNRYVDAMPELNEEEFAYSFRVLSAQRHAKVLGIFVRLSVRDGKERYLEFLPHVQNLFVSSLNDPVLKPLKDWFEEHNIDIIKPVSHFNKEEGFLI